MATIRTATTSDGIRNLNGVLSTNTARLAMWIWTDRMTKPKKYVYLRELREHFVRLGYPEYFIEKTMEEHPWSPQFKRTAQSGMRPEKLG